MGAIDVFDRYSESYVIQRKTTKWQINYHYYLLKPKSNITENERPKKATIAFEKKVVIFYLALVILFV